MRNLIACLTACFAMPACTSGTAFARSTVLDFGNAGARTGSLSHRALLRDAIAQDFILARNATREPQS